MSFKLMVHGWEAEVPTQSHRLVLMKLVDCCDDEGKNIFPKVATVAKAAKCSDRHVQRVIGEFCRIGLLRRIKAGGQGRHATTHYEMNLDLLFLLRRTDTWPAMMAAAEHQPEEEDAEGGDDGYGHAPDACDDDAEGPDSAHSKGDMRSPLAGDRVTPETPKGDKLSHPHLNPHESLNPEREGASVGAGDETGSVEAAAGHASGAEAEPKLPATLDAFCKAYPFAGADDQTVLASAWQGLPFEERQAAIDGIPGFLAWRKAAGFDKRLSAPKYLSGRNWKLVPAKLAEQAAEKAASASVQIAAWSRDWWLLLLDRVLSGRPAGFWVQQADGNKAMTATGADLTAAGKRVGELKPFICTGPEIDAWRPWLAARGARIPVFEGSFRVFLPSETPPGGRRDAGDDDVRL